MDIREGDVLVVAGKEYPIKACGEWQTDRMNTPGFHRMAKVTAGTKRPPAMAGGKRSAPEMKLTGLKCTPLDPYTPTLQEREKLKTPHELLETFLTDSSGFVRLLLEDIKR